MAGVEFSMSGGNFGAVNVASASVNPVLPALAGNHRPGIERPVSVGRYGEHSCHCAQPAEQWRPHLRPALLQNQRGMARRGLYLHGGVDDATRRAPRSASDAQAPEMVQYVLPGRQKGASRSSFAKSAGKPGRNPSR